MKAVVAMAVAVTMAVVDDGQALADSNADPIVSAAGGGQDPTMMLATARDDRGRKREGRGIIEAREGCRRRGGSCS
jgi:hypothetical protein